jgi:SAM-dependent methyltransferase
MQISRDQYPALSEPRLDNSFRGPQAAAYFARLADVEATHWWSRGMWRLAAIWLDGVLNGRRGLRALDIGCGAGMTLARLVQRVEIDSVVGLEPSPLALARARRFGVDLARGSLLALPFAARSFDLVTCFDVLQHLPEASEARAASELGRVLRPGGIALIRANGRGWARGVGPGLAPYRLDELAAFVAGAGLRVRRASYANCFPALAQEIRSRWRGDRSGHPAGGGLRIRVPSPWLNRVMGGVATIEAAVAGRLGVRLPFGHSTLILADRVG